MILKTLLSYTPLRLTKYPLSIIISAALKQPMLAQQVQHEQAAWPAGLRFCKPLITKQLRMVTMTPSPSTMTMNYPQPMRRTLVPLTLLYPIFFTLLYIYVPDIL